LQGYETYATDEDGFAQWYDKVTGVRYPGSATAANRTPEFGQRYEWRMPRDLVAKLAAKAQERPIFLCGAMANELEVVDLFALVVALDIDDETLRERLAARTNNDFGKSAHELTQVLGWQAEVRAGYRHAGYSIVDATRPIDEVVAEVLRLTVRGR
jgi:hypothetical protein